MAFKKVATLDDLWGGEMMGLLVDGRKVLLVNIDDTIYAYENKCAHKGTPLSEGDLDGKVLICGTHQWEYDVCTGKGINPESARLMAFAVKVEGGDILVDVEQVQTVEASAIGESQG